MVDRLIVCDICDIWDRGRGWDGGKGSMGEGGVGSPGRRGNFSAVEEAGEHSAHVGDLELGYAGDLCAVEGFGAVGEGFEDDAVFVGDGSEQGLDGLVRCCEPEQVWNALVSANDLKGESAGRRAEGVAGVGEYALLLVGGVGGDDEAAAGGGDGFQGARAAGRALADEEDGTVGALGELGQGSEEVAAALAAGGLGGVVEDGGEGVDDDQGGVRAGDGGFEEREVVGEGEGTFIEFGVGGVEAFGAVQEEDAGGVTASGQEARFEGVVGAVVGGDPMERFRSSLQREEHS